MFTNPPRRDFLKVLGGSLCYAALGEDAVCRPIGVDSVRHPAGYFALQPGDPAVLQPNSKRIVPDRLLALPQVSGLTIRARWAWLQPSRTSTDLGFLEDQAARCQRLGKSYKVLVMTGAGSSPKWIGGAWHSGAPVPWSPELREHYGLLVERLGLQFGNDALCVGTHITGPTFPSAEMHPAPAIESVAGFTLDVMREAWKASIDAYARAFPHTAACLSVSVKGVAASYVNDVIEHGRVALGDRFAVQHNALKASTQRGAPHQQLVAALAQDGVRTGYEMVCAAATAARRFGSPDVMNGIAIGKEAGGVYWDVYPPDLANLR